MSIETTESLLNRFDYVYERISERIEIKLGLGLCITVDFSQPEKVIIKDELTTWNFLTSTLDMSLKRALIFNFLASFLLIGIFTYTFGDEYLLVVFVVLLSLSWVSYWSGYYLIRAERMHHTIMRWNEN
jgi:hypothetical protein